MYRPLLFLALLATLIQAYGSLQVQIPEASALQVEDDDLNAQVKELQKNVSELWTYIYELRSAVSHHLTHLRQHQVEMESTIHRLEHQHDGHGGSHGEYTSHTDNHHHSGEQHSHSGEHHSHSGEHHSHSGEHHSHSGEHHSHSGEQHSHSGEQHSHSGGQHSHSGEHHHDSHSHSHSHTTNENIAAAHTHDEDHHHHPDHDHKNSHENDEDQQQTQQVAEPMIEPVVVATQHQSHYHHTHDQNQTTVRSSTSDPLQLMNENSYHHHHHHYDHHHHEAYTRNKTVILPKYSEYNLYDFAICNVQPNRAISEELQQEVVGQIALWEKKRGGPLNIHVRLQGFKIGDHHGGHHGAHQALQQEEDNETPTQETGHRHGFHVHASGDLSDGCQSTGPHYNPKNVNHGGPDALVRHVGDLGNIECDENGVTNIVFSDHIASLKGPYSIIGKAIVIHSDVDDLGLGNNPESLKTGNAGARLACCVIQKVEKLPVRTFKVIKTATQHQNR